MSERPGILAIWNDCAPGREAEFEEWYQHEHFHERIAVPGFLLGRRYEVVSGSPRYFCFYLTQSPDVLKSAAYLERLDNPTPMTHRIMSDAFRDMSRTVCHRTLRFGAMRGAASITVRFGESPEQGALKTILDAMVRDKAVACGEIWTAADAGTIPVSEEERLRGGDRKIAACLYVETLRVAEAEKVASELSSRYPAAVVGVYRLLCEIRPA
ncbi:MAG: hypothetical protein EXQ83_00845 [Xanthobacteraceae bacterium]|nr:hypothetical protein [Xanthobacteraceae bacterium]